MSERNCDIILFRPGYCPIRVKSVLDASMVVRGGGDEACVCCRSGARTFPLNSAAINFVEDACDYVVPSFVV